MGDVCCGLGLVFDFGVLWFVLGGFRFAGICSLWRFDWLLFGGCLLLALGLIVLFIYCLMLYVL